MVIYLIIWTLKLFFCEPAVSVWTSQRKKKREKKKKTYLRSLKTDQHANLISQNDPQIHNSGKNNENYNQ